MNDSEPGPPQWAIGLLRTICPVHLFEEIEGDLIQKFERDVKTFGERKARRRLIWNTILFFRPGIVMRNKFRFELNSLPMLRNYFKTTYRHVLKNKVNFAFKLGGLTLALFGLEKAAYEVAYEAENRPTWLPVPLHGLYGLLSGLKPFSDLGGE